MEDEQIMKAITPRVRQLMAMAAKAAEATGDNYIGLEHIEIAISQFRIEKARPGSTYKAIVKRMLCLQDEEVKFDVVVERKDVEKENLDQDEYEFIDPSNSPMT